MEVRLERLKTMRAAYSHSSSNTPEEDAKKMIIEWAKSIGLMEKRINARLFGRNTYPTDKPEPHGYELYLTVDSDIELGEDVEIREIPEGLYAVLRFTDLNKIREAWEKFWKWFKDSKYKPVDLKKNKHGWVNGFEEQVNWREEKPQIEWIFNLWVQIKE